MQQKSRLIEKMRLDALTDGVFAVAMTLLVIDLKLPENFRRPLRGARTRDLALLRQYDCRRAGGVAACGTRRAAHGKEDAFDRRIGLSVMIVVSLIVAAL